MEINFCRRCGQKVRQQTPGMYVCPNGHELFYKAYIGVNVILVNEHDEVLMATRARDPGKGTIDFPGGFIDLGETLEQAGKRELMEETGLHPSDYTPLELLYNGIEHYQYQGENCEVLGVFFWARMTRHAVTTPHDDVAKLEWVAPAKITQEEIYPGFESVWSALQLVRQRLLEK